MQAEEPIEPGRRAAAVYPAYRPSKVPLLAAVYGLGLLLFLTIEPTQPWILLVLTALVAIGTDGIMREHPLGNEEDDTAWTAPLLFLPTLLALGAGLFLEDVLTGYAAVPGALIATVLMGAVVSSEYASIDPEGADYPTARLVLNVATYLTAFSFYAVVYSFDVSLVPAALAAGLVSVLLSVEVLREAEADPVRALIFSGVVGVVVAEARWALYFLPLESYLAGVFLLLVFYMASGLVQHHLNDDLRPPVLAEFSAIAVLGVLIVTLGRIFESGS